MSRQVVKNEPSPPPKRPQTSQLVSSPFGRGVHNNELRVSLPPPSSNHVRQSVEYTMSQCRELKNLRCADQRELRDSLAKIDTRIHELTDHYELEGALKGLKRDSDEVTDNPKRRVVGDGVVIDKAADEKIEALSKMLMSVSRENERLKGDLHKLGRKIDESELQKIDLEAHVQGQKLKITALEQLIARLKRKAGSGGGVGSGSRRGSKAPFTPFQPNDHPLDEMGTPDRSGGNPSPRFLQPSALVAVPKDETSEKTRVAKALGSLRKRSVLDTTAVVVLDSFGASSVEEGPQGECCMCLVKIHAADELALSLPDEYAEALKLLLSVYKMTVDEFDGYESASVGHSFFLVFDDATSALGFSLSLQTRLLNDVKWNDALCSHDGAKEVFHDEDVLLFKGLRVGITLHFGQPNVWQDLQGGRTRYGGEAVAVLGSVSNSTPPGVIAITQEALYAKGVSAVTQSRSVFVSPDRHTVETALNRWQLRTSQAPENTSIKTEVSYVLPSELRHRITSNEEFAEELMLNTIQYSVLRGEDLTLKRKSIAIASFQLEGMEQLEEDVGEEAAKLAIAVFRRELQVQTRLVSEEIEVEMVLDDNKERVTTIFYHKEISKTNRTETVIEAARFVTRLDASLMESFEWSSDVLNWGGASTEKGGAGGVVYLRGPRLQCALDVCNEIRWKEREPLLGNRHVDTSALLSALGLSQVAKGGEIFCTIDFHKEFEQALTTHISSIPNLRINIYRKKVKLPTSEYPAHMFALGEGCVATLRDSTTFQELPNTLTASKMLTLHRERCVTQGGSISFVVDGASYQREGESNAQMELLVERLEQLVTRFEGCCQVGVNSNIITLSDWLTLRNGGTDVGSTFPPVITCVFFCIQNATGFLEFLLSYNWVRMSVGFATGSVVPLPASATSTSPANLLFHGTSVLKSLDLCRKCHFGSAVCSMEDSDTLEKSSFWRDRANRPFLKITVGEGHVIVTHTKRLLSETCPSEKFPGVVSRVQKKLTELRCAVLTCSFEGFSLSPSDDRVAAAVSPCGLEIFRVSSATILPAALNEFRSVVEDAAISHNGEWIVRSSPSSSNVYLLTFPNIQSATEFSIDVHQNLLDVKWPVEIMTSSEAKEVKVTKHGRKLFLFRGMRASIGICNGRLEGTYNLEESRLEYYGEVLEHSLLLSQNAPSGATLVPETLAVEISKLESVVTQKVQPTTSHSIDVSNVLCVLPRRLEERFKLFQKEDEISHNKTRRQTLGTDGGTSEVLSAIAMIAKKVGTTRKELRKSHTQITLALVTVPGVQSLHATFGWTKIKDLIRLFVK